MRATVALFLLAISFACSSSTENRSTELEVFYSSILNKADISIDKKIIVEITIQWGEIVVASPSVIPDGLEIFLTTPETAEAQMKPGSRITTKGIRLDELVMVPIRVKSTDAIHACSVTLSAHAISSGMIIHCRKN